MIKLFFRRYILILILFFLIYTSLFYLSNTNENNYFNISFFVCLIYTYQIRFFDDILDYDIDRKNNKIIFRKWLLLSIFITFSIINIIIVCLYNRCLFFISFFLILLLLINSRKLRYLKSLILPVLITILVYYEFSFNIYIYLVLGLLIILDLFLVRR